RRQCRPPENPAPSIRESDATCQIAGCSGEPGRCTAIPGGGKLRLRSRAFSAKLIVESPRLENHERKSRMPRRPAARSRIRAKEQPAPGPTGPPSRNRWKLGLAGLSIVVALAMIGQLYSGSPARLRAEAERAARAEDWAAALRAWRAFNATSAARGATHLAEARAALAIGYAGQAERSLRRAVAADPADPE